MMGACFECLVEIDGEPNRQACMTPVTEGMKVRPMKGARALPKGEPGEN
jgi:NADH dehydrogenase/NADH:ubiquinone oxidoreductase subunit G